MQTYTGHAVPALIFIKGAICVARLALW